MRLEKCGDCCPEQYDVYHGKLKVGYLRLRHGRFTVQCPNVCGEVILTVHPKGDGEFDDDERDFYLNMAKEAIKTWMKENNYGR